MKPKEWKYRWTRLSNRLKLERNHVVPVDEKGPFVAENGKTKDIQVQPANTCDEKESEDKPEEEKIPPVGFCSLFRYASCCDMLLVGIAVFVALASGASMPGIMIIFGEVIDQFVGFTPNNTNTSVPGSNTSISTDVFLQKTAELCMWNAVFGLCILLCNYTFVSFFSIAAANQAFRIRCRFMQAVLRQEIGWYDTHQTGDFATRITGDLARNPHKGRWRRRS